MCHFLILFLPWENHTVQVAEHQSYVGDRWISVRFLRSGFHALLSSALPCFAQNIELLYIFFALCCKAQYVMEWFLGGAERAGWSIMCNLATISTGARVTKYQGGCLSNLSLRPPSHNDNSRSLTGWVLHFHNGGKRGTPFFFLLCIRAINWRAELGLSKIDQRKISTRTGIRVFTSVDPASLTRR